MRSYFKLKKNLPNKDLFVLKNKNSMKTMGKIKEDQGCLEKKNLIH